MFCPANTPLGPLFTTCRSAWAFTPTSTPIELLALFGSGVVGVTEPPAEASPPFGGAFIEIVSVGRELLTGSVVVDVQVMVPDGTPHDQPVPLPLTLVAPDGGVNVTLIVPVDGSGPLLLMVMS